MLTGKNYWTMILVDANFLKNEKKKKKILNFPKTMDTYRQGLAPQTILICSCPEMHIPRTLRMASLFNRIYLIPVWLHFWPNCLRWGVDKGQGTSWCPSLKLHEWVCISEHPSYLKTWPYLLSKTVLELTRDLRWGSLTFLPTYPSPKPTFCPKWEVNVNVGLGEG